MTTVLRCLVIGLLIAGVAAGCGNDSSSTGDNPKPESSNSQGDDGGGYGY